MVQKVEDLVNLLWTGGWDSTFRLLQLVLVFDRIVQPYYIIDSDRRSTGIELQTMKNIKKQLFIKHPKTQKLLLPTKFREISDILPNQELTQKFERIIKHNFLGSQYEWIPRFCSENSIKEIELCVHRDDTAHKVLEHVVVPCGTEKYQYYKVHENYSESDEYGLFHFFRFPIFNLTKLEMQSIAGNEGFEKFMNLTWFCHHPRNYSRPCGVCNPCIYTIQEGLGRRIPFASRIRYYSRIRPRVKNLLRKYPLFCNLLRTAKRQVVHRNM